MTQPPHASSDLAGRRVLVVEDTFLVAEMITDVLESAGCVIVGPAARLAQGLSLAPTAAIDFALLDVNLSGEQSFPIAAVLQGRGVPFAFLTGYGEDAVPREFRGTPCINKPFQSSQLLRVLREGVAG